MKVLFKAAAGFVRAAGIVLCLALCASSASRAQGSYPNKPIRVLVPFGPGGVSDVITRLVADPLSQELGQPVVVENRVGAGGLIATRACIDAPPDGYTLCLGSTSTVILAPLLVKEANFESLRVLQPVSALANFPGFIGANPKIGVKTPEDFVRWARANPGAGFANGGIGTLFYLLGLHMNHELGTKLEPINYKGGTPAVADTLSGVTPIVIETLVSGMPHFKAGTLVPIVTTGTQRTPLLPSVPTASETFLPKFKVDSFQGLFAPAGIPPATLARLSAALRKVGTAPALRNRIVELGGIPVMDTPEEFAGKVRANTPFFQELVRSSGLKPQ